MHCECHSRTLGAERIEKRDRTLSRQQKDEGTANAEAPSRRPGRRFAFLSAHFAWRVECLVEISRSKRYRISQGECQMKTLIRALAAVAAGTMLTTAFAQSAKEVRGSTPYIEIKNEAAPKLIVDPPLPEGLA